MEKLRVELLRVLDITYDKDSEYKKRVLEDINRHDDTSLYMAQKLLSENKSLTVEVFDLIKSNYANRELVVRDEKDDHIIREMKILVCDNHYDFDKNDKQAYPPKMRWNNKDSIYDWQVGCIKRGDFTILRDVIEIVGKKDGKFNIYKFRIKDNLIEINHSKLKEFVPIPWQYEDDALVAIKRFRKRISEMDILAKDYILSVVDNAKLDKAEN